MKISPLKILLMVAIIVTGLALLSACGDQATATSAPGNTTTGAIITTGATGTQNNSTIAQTTAAAATTPGASPTPATTVALPTGAGTPTPTPGAKGGYTLKEAYLAIDPQVKEWQADAVYVAIFNNLEQQIGIDPDGRSMQWYFQAVSLKAGHRITWLVAAQAGGKPNITKTGDEELTGEKLKVQADQALPPIPTLIDTNDLMAVARANGGDKSDRPVGFRLAKSSKEGAPLSYDLIFDQGDKTILIRVDALTGKLLDNARG